MIVLTIVTFLSAELFLRNFYFGLDSIIHFNRYTPQGFFELGHLEKVEDTKLKWKLKSNINGFIKGAPFKTNSLGFRDDEIQSTHQILAFGRSLSLGEGVAFENTWPQVLESELVKRDGPFTHVHNMGISGYNINQEERTFQIYGPILKPKITIFPIYLEEWDAIIKDEWTNSTNSWLARITFNHLLSFFFTSSAIRKVNQGLFRMVSDANWTQFEIQKHPEPRTLQTELARIVYTFKEHSESVIILILPSSRRLPTAVLQRSDAILKQWAEKQPHLKIIDSSRLLALAGSYSAIFYGDSHPGTQFHKDLSKIIYDQLEALKLLD